MAKEDRSPVPSCRHGSSLTSGFSYFFPMFSQVYNTCTSSDSRIQGCLPQSYGLVLMKAHENPHNFRPIYMKILKFGEAIWKSIGHPTKIKAFVCFCPSPTGSLLLEVLVQRFGTAYESRPLLCTAQFACGSSVLDGVAAWNARRFLESHISG